MSKISINFESETIAFDGKGVKSLKFSKYQTEAECAPEQLRNLSVHDFPCYFEVSIYDFENLRSFFFDRLWLARDNEDQLLICAYFNAPGGVWNNDIAIGAICRELFYLLKQDSDNESYEYQFDGEDWFWVSTYVPIDSKNLHTTATDFVNNLSELIDVAQQRVYGFSWNPNFEKDEQLFTKELLIPLFRKMGFASVKYNHGQREFGKDILLTEHTKLFHDRHISVQVKAGNVSGGANRKLDSIVSQLVDSLDVPVESLGAFKMPRIGESILVISGKFTDNAKTKINAKIPSYYQANISFLDKDDIEWLAQKHWPF